MTAREITLVQSTFRAVAPIADQAAALFYARLFELDPALRSLFRGDMQEQGRKLMSVLGLAVGSLEKLDQLLPAVRHLGVRHVGYGVDDSHYATVGAALLLDPRKGLGSAFTPRSAPPGPPPTQPSRAPCSMPPMPTKPKPLNAPAMHSQLSDYTVPESGRHRRPRPRHPRPRPQRPLRLSPAPFPPIQNRNPKPPFVYTLFPL